MPQSFEDRRARFAALHKSGCFVIPNPWDRGTAKYLAKTSFKALATTSAGMQFARGEPDTVWGVPVESALAHIREIVEATELPVNADFQSGYGRTLEELRRNVTACVHSGVAGLSIEDATGETTQPLYELSEALDRLRAARAAIDATGAKVLLTARAECFLIGHPEPLQEAIKRLSAYADAGADVLYAPGLKRREDIGAIVRAVAPKPVNVLVSGNFGLSVQDLENLGVRRISVGSALARTAWGAFMRAAREIGEQGRFDRLAEAATFDELNAVFDAERTRP